MRARRGGLGGQVLGKPLEVPRVTAPAAASTRSASSSKVRVPFRGGIAHAGHYALALGVRGADGRSPGVFGHELERSRRSAYGPQLRDYQCCKERVERRAVHYGAILVPWNERALLVPDR